MGKLNYCLTCGGSLMNGLCQRCADKGRPSKDTARGKCAFRAGQAACPLPGVYAAPRGDRWHCWLHNDPQKIDEAPALAWIIEHQKELIAERYPPPKVPETMNPELAHRPGESFEDYLRRCRKRLSLRPLRPAPFNYEDRKAFLEKRFEEERRFWSEEMGMDVRGMTLERK